MTEDERKTEDLNEYTFIDRNARPARRAGELRGLSGSPDAESDETPGEESPDSGSGQMRTGRSALRNRKPLRGIALVLAVQTVLAAIPVAGAAVVRLIGGETAREVARQVEQLTASGALDLPGIFAKTATESEESAEAGSKQTESEPASFPGEDVASALRQEDASAASEG